MTHHLVVYIFYLVGSGSTLGEADAMVLARQESPGFSLISHRRSGHNSNNAECDLPVFELARDSQFATLSFDPTEAVAGTSRGITKQQYEQQLQRQDPTTRANFEGHYAATQNKTNRDGIDIGGAATERASTEDITWRQHQLDARACDFREKGQQLLILWKFVHYISLSDIGCAAELVHPIIRSYWLRAAGALGGMRRSQTHLEDVVSSFLKEICKSTPYPSTYSFPTMRIDSAQEVAIIRAIGYLFLRAMSSINVQRLLQSVGKTQNIETSLSELQEHFVSLISGLYDAVGDLLRDELVELFSQHAASSIPALVDDVLSVVYGQPHFSALRPHMSLLLLAPGSLSDALNSMFEAFTAQTRVNIDALVTKCPQVDGRSGLSMWNHRFLLEPGSVRIASLMPGTTHTLIHDMRLMDVAQLVSEFGCIDMKITDDARCLLLRSALFSAGSTPMTLVLDGQLHVFQVMPSGVSSMIATTRGWSVGDYRAAFSSGTHSLKVDVFAIAEESACDSTRAMNLPQLDARSNSMLVRWTSLAISLEEEIDAASGCASELFAYVRGTVHGSMYTPPSSYKRKRSSALNLLKTSTLGQETIWDEVEWTPLWELQTGYIAV